MKRKEEFWLAHGKYFRLSLIALLLIFGLTGFSNAQSKPKTQKVLIETPKPYDRIVNAIKARGGSVTWEYKYVDGLAAVIPEDAIGEIRALVGSSSVEKDLDVPRPTVVGSNRSQESKHQFGVATARAAAGPGMTSANLQTFAASHPEAYSLNNAGTRIEKLHAKGFTGQGIIVAMIDSGVRPSYKLVSGWYVGGVDFVDDGPPGPVGDSPTDWQKDSNDGHGTFGAGLISGNGTFSVTGVLQSALQQYAPAALVDGKLPIIGTAPEAQLYIVRVFGDNSTVGASKSTIIAAIQHVIEQRELFDRTNGRQGVKIEVANISLGISTLAAGRTLMDLSVDAMLSAGIIPVAPAGNVGPATLTLSSPGSAMSAVTVGGISRAANERLLNEVKYQTDFPAEYYPGIGGDIRPFQGTEVAYFSSRGPNADGRPDPDVVANAVGSIGQGYCPDQVVVDACFQELSIVNGTSFSAPIVSGIAAALRQAFPNASATRIRNAIIASGRVSQVEAYFDVQDRGMGLPDAWAAYQLLASGSVDKSLPRANQPKDLVERNIRQNTDLVVESGFFSKAFKNLRPGERGEILYDVPQGTERVIVKVRNVVLTGPQNPFFGGDAMFFYVHSAKTSSIGALGDYLTATPFFGGESETEFGLDDPDTGIIRIVVNPDTLNAGTVNAEVSVEAIAEAWPHAAITGTINDGATKNYTVAVKNGTTRMDFLLAWDHDWAHYPTNDVDLIVCSPDITTVADCTARGIKDGATLAGPERVSVTNPVAGNWMIIVRGFNVPTGTDAFKVRITQIRP